MRHRALIIIIGCVALTLLACARHTPTEKPPPPRVLQKIAELREDEILVVGKIEVVPPIVPFEQRTLAEDHRNKVSLVFRDEPKHIGQLASRDRRGWVTVPIDETFFVALPKSMRFFLGTSILMRVDKTSEGRARLPTSSVILGGTQDRALYLGTIRYFRDEYFSVTRIEIIDEFDSARRQMSQRFADTITLKKGLVADPKKHSPNTAPRSPRKPPV